MLSYLGYIFTILLTVATALSWRRKLVRYRRGDLSQTTYLITYFAEPYLIVEWLIISGILLVIGASSLHLFYIVPITYVATCAYFVKRAMEERKRILRSRQEKQKEFH